MSSFIRRIERTQHPSRAVHYKKDEKGKKTGEPFANPPRGKHFKGRGAQLGVSNPRAKDLLARLARESRNKARKEI